VTRDAPEAGGVDGDLTVLFADISGSTRLYEERGDEAARELLLGCLGLMADVVTRAGGRVIERIGDELLCTFPDPAMAALAAARMQTAVSGGGERTIGGPRMRLRIGFLHGPVIEGDGRIFGTTVHTAARLASMAKAGQTITAKETVSLLGAMEQMTSRYFDTVVLKGRTGEVEVYELPWNLDVTTKGTAPAPRLLGQRTAAVELEYDGRMLRVDASNPRVEIGRDPACDLRVEGEFVSALHAIVTWNRDQTHVADISTNGTDVRRQSGDGLRILHGGTALTGTGELRLGGDDGAPVVRFRCIGG